MDGLKFSVKHGSDLVKAKKSDELRQYIKQFFFKHLTQVFFFDGASFKLYELEQAQKLIPRDWEIVTSRANEETQKFIKETISFKNYLKDSDFMECEYTPTIDFNKPKMFTKKVVLNGEKVKTNFLNMAKPMNHEISTVKSKRSESTLNELGLVYEHINDVLCSSDKSMNEYVLNFFACTFGGRKLRKALILQSAERTGKGQIINGLLNSILGDRMFKTNSVETITKYNKNFEGCALINFDELPHCDNYKGLQDILKGLITEPTFTCRDMYSSGYDQLNTFNIIITSNNDSIGLTQNNNSRYVVLDISEHRIGDTSYFQNLTKALNNLDVKRAFYEDMIERFEALTEWSEDIIPESESRKTKIIEALPCIYKFIKEQFILKSCDLNMKTNDFFDFYKDKTKDKTTVNKIGRFLAKLEIKPIKMSNNAGYKYVKSSKELLETFQKLNFMDDTVDHISNNDPEPGSLSHEAPRKLGDAPESELENIYKSKYEAAMKRIQELEQVLSKQNPHAWQEKLLKKQTQEEEEPINDLDVIVDIMLR